MHRFLSIIILSALSATTLAMDFTPARKISLDTKIGQMVMVGFKGQNINDKSLHELKTQITSGEVGGVIFFSRNIKNKKQIKDLTYKLNDLAPLPLFLAIDQEGGAVARLNSNNGFKNFSSPIEVANHRSPDGAYKIYYEMAKQLKETGFTLNLAPVVDLEPGSDVAPGRMTRSFSNDPEVVVDYAQAFIKAHHNNAVLTALKHFPGISSTTRDTHQGAVDVTDTWKEIELKPYQKLIKDNSIDMIMSSHIFNSKIDSLRPASLSKKHIQEILRNKLGYRGVIITDDLQMGAISKHYNLENTVILAINAGNDILLFANSFKMDKNLPDKINKIIKKAINEGKISEKRIDKSFKRIITLKRKF